jgi:hypothetical protein
VGDTQGIADVMKTVDGGCQRDDLRHVRYLAGVAFSAIWLSAKSAGC